MSRFERVLAILCVLCAILAIFLPAGRLARHPREVTLADELAAEHELVEA